MTQPSFQFIKAIGNGMKRELQVLKKSIDATACKHAHPSIKGASSMVKPAARAPGRVYNHGRTILPTVEGGNNATTNNINNNRKEKTSRNFSSTTPFLTEESVLNRVRAEVLLRNSNSNTTTNNNNIFVEAGPEDIRKYPAVNPFFIWTR
jgi:hypothetical protein